MQTSLATWLGVSIGWVYGELDGMLGPTHPHLPCRLACTGLVSDMMVPLTAHPSKLLPAVSSQHRLFQCGGSSMRNVRTTAAEGQARQRIGDLAAFRWMLK